jgi:hypothetical protein
MYELYFVRCMEKIHFLFEGILFHSVLWKPQEPEITFLVQTSKNEVLGEKARTFYILVRTKVTTSMKDHHQWKSHL